MHTAGPHVDQGPHGVEKQGFVHDGGALRVIGPFLGRHVRRRVEVKLGQPELGTRRKTNGRRERALGKEEEEEEHEEGLGQ